MRSNGYKTEHKISVEETGKTYTRFNDNGKVTWCTMTKERFRIVGSKFRSELERTYQRNLTSIKGSAIFKPVLNFNDPKSTIVSYKTKIPNNSWVRYMSYGLINGEFKIVRYQVKVYEEILKSAARDNKSLFAPGNDALKVRIEWVEVRNDFKVPNVHLALKVRIEWVEVRNDFKVPNVHLETVKNGYPCDLKQLQEMHAASGLNLEIALQRETLKANEEWAKRSQKLLKVNDNIGVFE